MSMELFVILAAAQAPDAEAWNRALADAHVPIELSADADLSKSTGFLPVTLDGNKTGFRSFILESFSEIAEHYAAIAKLKVGRPVVYSLGYGGDFTECAAVFYSASVLVERFGGLAFEPQGGLFMSKGDLLNAAKECQRL